MIQEDSYQIKFTRLEPWAKEIFQAIKRDIKAEYLRQNPQFIYKHFQKKALDKLTLEEIADACQKEIAEGNEEFAEWIVTRWVMKHAELYQFFATELSKVNPQFDQIVSIPADVAEQLLKFALLQFGAKKTYIFAVMNAVSFSEEIYQKLRAAAENEGEIVEEKAGEESVDALKKRHEAMLQKLVDKYEKRLQGQEKKYFVDTEGFKKQIAQLHKKLGEMTRAG